MYMIFLNLVVRDLARSRDFYQALGFRLEQHSSDERSAALVVDDKIVIVLVTQDLFTDLAPVAVGDPAASSTSVYQLSVGGREEIDDLVAKAEASGGQVWTPRNDEPSNRTGGFTDPDGHVWQVRWMEPLHVID